MFSLFICLEATKFDLESFFTLIEMICRKILSKTVPKNAKSLLPVEVCTSVTYKPNKLQNHTNEGKRKEKKQEGRKEEKRKKAMVALLVFITATLEIMFWPV